MARIVKVDGTHPALSAIAELAADGHLIIRVSRLSPKTRRGLGHVDIEGLHSETLSNQQPAPVRIRRFGRATV